MRALFRKHMDRRITNNKFLKNVSTLVAGSFFAQVIAVAASPILTRIYPVQEIGKFTYFLSVAQTFMGVVCLRYDAPIVYEKDESRVNALIKLCFIITITSSLVVSLIFGVYSLFIVNRESNGIITVLLLFLALISYGVINTLSAYNNRREEYRIITSTYFVRISFHSIASLLTGLISANSFSIVIPYVMAQFLGVKKQASGLKKKWSEVFHVDNNDVVTVAKHYKNLPLYSTPAVFANTFSYSSITMIIEALYGLSVVGYYSMTIRILGLPIALISGNVARVFFKDATAEYQKIGKFSKSFLKTIIMMLAISIPFVLVVMIFAPTICRIVFGPEWEISGVYMRILMPMFGLRFIATTVTPSFQIIGKQRTELVLQVFLLVASIVSYIIASTHSLAVESFLMVVNWSKFLIYLIFIVVVGMYGFVSNPVTNSRCDSVM